MKKLSIFFALTIFSSIGYSSINLDLKSSNTCEYKGIPSPQVAQVASLYKGIVKLHVKLGEKVRKGQLLFSIDPSNLIVEKSYDVSNLKFMEMCMIRAEQLVKNHSISVDSFQQTKRDLIDAKNCLINTEEQISYTNYYSTFEGTVTKIVRYNGSGLGDNDDEVEVTQGNVTVDTQNPVGLVCTRWPGILDLKVKLGEKVRKGQLLFKIKTGDIEAQKRIDVSNMVYAKEFYEREKRLSESKGDLGSPVSFYAYYKSYIDYLDAVKKVELDQIQINQSSAYAPFDGTVSKVYRYTGSANGSGKPVIGITS